MTVYLEHITRDDERWDRIAYDYYQDVSKMGLLMEENQHAPLTPCLPAGLKLRIPLIEEQPETVDLPPWKR